MRRVIVVILLVLVSGNITAQSRTAITKDEVLLAWEHAEHDKDTLHDLIMFMTGLKVVGYQDMDMFFLGYRAFRASGISMGSGSDVLDYNMYLIDVTRDIELASLVFSDDVDMASIHNLASSSLRFARMASRPIVQEQVIKNQDEAKKILNSR